jgi:hypothetical protein
MDSVTILNDCLNLLHIRDNAELLSLLEMYKEQPDGQKEAIKIAFELKKQRQEARKTERKLKSKVEANERHQRDNIYAAGYP